MGSARVREASLKRWLAGGWRRSLSRLLIYAGALMVAVVVAWLALKAYRIYTIYQELAPHLTDLQALASEGMGDVTGLDLVRLENDLRGVATSLEKLSDEARPFLPLTPYLGWVPRYGGDIQAAPYILTAALDLSRVGVILFDQFRPLLELQGSAGQTTILEGSVALLADGQAHIETAERLLRAAHAQLEQVDERRLSPRLASRVAPLRQYLPIAISGLEVAPHLPGLLGGEGPRTYLLLMQNSDELRPTGGFISTAGHITFDKRRVVQFVVQDSYAVDHLSDAYPYPPEPIRQYLAADYWGLRDANWSPDFPTSARTAMELYELGQGITASGVIALDQQAVSYLLRAFEPIDVHGEPVTSKNVIKLMRQHWAPTPEEELDNEWWRQRKSFMVDVAQAVMQRIEHDLESVNLRLLLDAVQQGLAEKHILVSMSDPEVARFLEKENWAGALRPVEGDYLMVVDANVGLNKASALVERHLSYSVILARDGSAQVRVEMMYQHRGRRQTENCRPEARYDRVYEQNMERCYWNYVRLIVPNGAQLVTRPDQVVGGRYLLRGRATTGEVDVVPLSDDKVSWGQLFLLSPGENLELEYLYLLPPGSARNSGGQWQYELYLQKQPGTLDPAVEVTVTLPHGTQYIDSLPEPDSQAGNVVTYSLRLATDQRIQLLYR